MSRLGTNGTMNYLDKWFHI